MIGVIFESERERERERDRQSASLIGPRDTLENKSDTEVLRAALILCLQLCHSWHHERHE